MLLNMLDESTESKLNRIRSCMLRDGVDYYIVFTSDPHLSEYISDHYKFREYLSGFTGSAGTLVIGLNTAGLWTDGRYFIQAAEEIDESVFTLYKSGEVLVPTISEFLSEHAVGKCVGFSSVLCSKNQYDIFLNLASKNIKILDDVDYSDEVFINRPKMETNEIYCLHEEISGISLGSKIDLIRNKLIDNKADAILLTNLVDIMWAFNLRGSDVEYSPVAFSYAIIYAKRNAYIYLNKDMCSDDAKRMLDEEKMVLKSYNEAYSDFSEVKNIKVICDMSSTNAYLYNLIDGNNTILSVPVSDIIDKHIKNTKEIELSKKYHYEDGLAVTKWIFEIKKRILKGESITEYEAARRVDELRRECNEFIEPSFATICAYDDNGAVIHYEPKENNSKNIENHGFLLLDSGGQYLGATTDITRTISLGELSDEMKRDYTAVLKGHLALMNVVFLEGCAGENLDILARKALWKNYRDYRHGTSHGVGSMLSVHETPPRVHYKISKGSVNNILKEGMILSDEPGIYIANQYGIRIENLILCHVMEENEWGRFLGFDNLTFVPYESDAIIPEMLDEEEKSTLNRINEQIYKLYSDRLNEEERAWLLVVTKPI